MIRIDETLRLDDREVEERFVRAVGRGGHNLNKEAIAVELRLDLRASSLPSDVKERLMAIAGRAVTNDDVVVVVSRAHRSQTGNREAARTRLLRLLQRAARVPKKRLATRPALAAREERLSSKHIRAGLKKSRGRVHDGVSSGARADSLGPRPQR